MLYLKETTQKDKDLLYIWANEEESMKQAFSPHFIELKEHENWFSKKLKDKNCKMYLLYQEDTPVGEIRVECKEGTARISYSIAKEYRGQGYGKKLLELLEQEIESKPFQFSGIKTLKGEVLQGNEASRHVFLALGYQEEVKDGFYVYRKEL